MVSIGLVKAVDDFILDHPAWPALLIKLISTYSLWYIRLGNSMKPYRRPPAKKDLIIIFHLGPVWVI
jgi:hypothetical protein